MRCAFWRWPTSVIVYLWPRVYVRLLRQSVKKKKTIPYAKMGKRHKTGGFSGNAKRTFEKTMLNRVWIYWINKQTSDTRCVYHNVRRVVIAIKHRVPDTCTSRNIINGRWISSFAWLSCYRAYHKLLWNHSVLWWITFFLAKKINIMHVLTAFAYYGCNSQYTSTTYL